jgi:hypothetical protein
MAQQRGGVTNGSGGTKDPLNGIAGVK